MLGELFHEENEIERKLEVVSRTFCICPFFLAKFVYSRQ